MVLLIFGDIFGKPGRQAIARALPELKLKYCPDFIFGNVENLAGGRGVNRKTLNELIALGFHGFTSGNHIWDNKEVYSIMETETRLLRPANYPDFGDYPCHGTGSQLFESNGKRLYVVNLMGRVYMDAIDCPFQKINQILDHAPDCPIFVDLHADATSEKYAMGWHLDGRVSVLVGTHSHVQTADERILPEGTAYITDVGMSGSFDSVIGVRKDEVVRKFLTKRHAPYVNARENPGYCCIVVQIDDRTKKAVKIERIRQEVRDLKFDEESLE